MNGPPVSRAQSLVVPACIIAASIIAAAFIVPHRITALASSGPATPLVDSEAGSISPKPQLPIERSSIERQFIEQVKRSSAGKTFVIQGLQRQLVDVRVSDVRLSNSRATLLISHEMTWQPALTTPVDTILVDDSFGRFEGRIHIDWNIPNSNDGRTGMTIREDITIK